MSTRRASSGIRLRCCGGLMWVERRRGRPYPPVRRSRYAHYFQLDRSGLVIDAGHFAVETSSNGTLTNSTVQLPEDIDMRRSNYLCKLR
jgi:hypothetical protein